MLQIGTIKEIWRYPVKGMAGERVEACGLEPTGLHGDRIWALRDTARREIQSCKFRPLLLLCSARCRAGKGRGRGGHVDVFFHDGTTLGSDDAAIHGKLSALTGRPSTLESLRPASDREFYSRHKLDDHTWLEELKDTFDREPYEPLPPGLDRLERESADYASVRGTFFLVTPFHIVTTATLAHLKGRLPESDWEVRRFRPNVVIETTSAAKGLVEQDWLGKRLLLADAAVDCTESAPRCGVISRAQRDFGPDTPMLRTIVKEAEQNVGIYGCVVKRGHLRCGDPVYLS